MEEIINFIVQDATTFEPKVMVGIIVFVLILESLMTLVGNITKGVRK